MTARTRDGAKIYIGMTVFRTNTRNGGKSWFITEHTVVELRNIHEELCVGIDPDDLYLGSLGWYSTQGHNRFFSTRDAANQTALEDVKQ